MADEKDLVRANTCGLEGSHHTPCGPCHPPCLSSSHPHSGDRGFDPLSLGTNPETLKWFAEAELTNGRWAMAAVAGILFTDLVGLPKFWLAGAEVSILPSTTSHQNVLSCTQWHISFHLSGG